MVVGPIAVVVLVVVLDHAHPMRSNVVALLWPLAAWGVALAGVHFMPLPRAHRFVIAFLVTPMIGYVVFVTTLVLSCAWYGSCL